MKNEEQLKQEIREFRKEMEINYFKIGANLSELKNSMSQKDFNNYYESLFNCYKKDKEDGRNKHLCTTEVVECLNIENLTSTLYNKWLCHHKFGKMIKVKGENKVYFQPNQKFENSVAKNGYAHTGTTRTGKTKVSYNPSILEVLNQVETRQSIIDFVQRETINPFK